MGQLQTGKYGTWVLTALALAGSVLYFQTTQRLSPQENVSSPASENPASFTESLGSLWPQGPDLRIQKNQSAWAYVHDDQHLKEQDSIYVGPHSRLEIKLREGGRVWVLPKTLLKVSSKDSSPVFELQYGGLVTELTDSQKILARHNRRLSEFSGDGALFLQRQPAYLTAETLRGQIQGAQEAPPSLVELIAPARGEHLWLHQKQIVQFKWRGNETPVRFKISYSPDMKDALSREVEGQELSVSLSPATQYFWQIEDLDDVILSPVGIVFTWQDHSSSLAQTKSLTPRSGVEIRTEINTEKRIQRSPSSTESFTLPAPSRADTTQSLSIPAPKAPSKKHLRLQTGMGASYLKFQQQDSSGLEGGNFTSSSTGSLMFNASLQWNENWRYSLNYATMPGKIKASNAVTLNKADFNRSYLGFEVERKLMATPSGWDLFASAGVQRNEMPFLVGGTVFDVDMVDTEVLTGSVGLQAQWNINKVWTLESLLRYQMPLSSKSQSGGNFNINGGSSLEGLLGASHRLGEQWRLGLYWFAQTQQLNYDYVSSDGSTSRQGKQEALNSDIQVRVGYEWYFGNLVLFIPAFRRKSKEDSDS